MKIVHPSFDFKPLFAGIKRNVGKFFWQNVVALSEKI